MQADHIIAAVHVTDRLKKAQEVQKLLTEYGCHIKTRLGLHETTPSECSPNGILILELVGEPARCHELIEKLNGLQGIEAKVITFSHPRE